MTNFNMASLVALASLLFGAACAQPEAEPETVTNIQENAAKPKITEASKEDETEAANHPKKTRQQEELDAAIELMRAQGVPEEQIEQFREAAQGFVDKTPSEEKKEKVQEERSAKRAEEDFERRYGDAPKISIKLGPDSYELTRTVCQNEPDNFRVAGSSDEGETTVTFSYSRERLTDTLIQSSLRLNIGDRNVRLSEDTAPPWSYSQAAYSFAGEVNVRTLFGPTSNRQQSIEKVRLTVTAPC